MRITLAHLRARAVGASLFPPTTLAAAVRQMGFVQADPIRAPARAQDLILRHRVTGYRAGDLERRYPRLKLEEDVVYAYGFMPREVWRLLHVVRTDGLTKLERQVLEVVGELGDTHPRDLDARFGRTRVTNDWGGFSKASKRALEALHRRGLVRVARRDSGVRVYQLAPPAAPGMDPAEGFAKLVLIAAAIFAPAPEARLIAALAPLRWRRSVTAKRAREILDGLCHSGQLERARVDGVDYVWPADTPTRSAPRVLRLLAPFDPLVWDRQRFEHLWGWPYRFEAYTPARKRVRGYYAMPLLWREQVIGWANVSGADSQLDVELGFVDKRPSSKVFTSQLEAEIERLRRFLLPRGT